MANPYEYQPPPPQGHGWPGHPPPQPPKSSSTTVVIILVVVIGALFVLPVVAALGIYGVRRYLQSAKTTEAKNSLGAIARGVVGAAERPDASGKPSGLCGAAQPVPATVPSGRKYMPSAAPGTDFETGSETIGWKCLRFTVATPMYYQYEYRVGGNYKGTARGAKDPGPNGFEISAEGDLDADGNTSLFIRTGTFDAATGKVTLDSQLTIFDEFE